MCACVYLCKAELNEWEKASYIYTGATSYHCRSIKNNNNYEKREHCTWSEFEYSRTIRLFTQLIYAVRCLCLCTLVCGRCCWLSNAHFSFTVLGCLFRLQDSFLQHKFFPIQCNLFKTTIKMTTTQCAGSGLFSAFNFGGFSSYSMRLSSFFWRIHNAAGNVGNNNN